LEPMSTILRSRRTLVVIVVGAWLLAACTNGRSPECEAFLALSPTNRDIEFKKYSAARQIDMYLCATKQEPPGLELADQISDRGEEAIPLLMEKLKTANSEVDKHDLIYVFEVMSRTGYLRGRTDVVAEISDIVNGMKVAPVKEDSRERLKKIQINSGVKPFTYVH
jgi:hypothetical protein